MRSYPKGFSNSLLLVALVLQYYCAGTTTSTPLDESSCGYRVGQSISFQAHLFPAQDAHLDRNSTRKFRSRYIHYPYLYERGRSSPKSMSIEYSHRLIPPHKDRNITLCGTARNPAMHRKAEDPAPADISIHSTVPYDDSTLSQAR